MALYIYIYIALYSAWRGFQEPKHVAVYYLKWQLIKVVFDSLYHNDTKYSAPFTLYPSYTVCMHFSPLPCVPLHDLPISSLVSPYWFQTLFQLHLTTPLVLVTNYSTTPLFTTNCQQTSLFVYSTALWVPATRFPFINWLITSRTCRLSERWCQTSKHSALLYRVDW
jgi:hypothetical protein